MVNQHQQGLKMIRYLLAALMAVNPVVLYGAELADLPNTQQIGWNGRAIITSNADGELTVSNAAGTGFAALNFAGGGALIPYLTGAADPTTSNFTASGDFGIYKNTTSGAMWLAINDSGTIVKSQIGDDSALYENAGAYEINVGGLSGELADPQPVTVGKNGTDVAAQPEINFVEGSNVTITATDDAANNRVNVAIAAATGGSATSAKFFDPTDYYEVADGTDWAPAINRCFDAMSAEFANLQDGNDLTESRPLVCVFPTGTYEIGSTCYLPSYYSTTETEPDRPQIAGNRPGRVLILGYGATIKATGSEYDLFKQPNRLVGGHGNGCASWIEGFYFEGASGSERALADRGTVVEDHMDIVQCVPNTTQTGINIGVTVPEIEGIGYDNTSASPSAHVIQTCSFSKIDVGIKYAGFNCNISRCTFSLMNVGIYFPQSLDQANIYYSTTNRILDCRCITLDNPLHGIGIWLQGTDNMWLQNCTFEGGSLKYAILIENDNGYSWGDHQKPSIDIIGTWEEMASGTIGSHVHCAGGYQTGFVLSCTGVRGRISMGHARYTSGSASGSMHLNMPRQALSFGAVNPPNPHLGAGVEYDALTTYDIGRRCWAAMPWDGVDGQLAKQQYLKYQEGTYAAPAIPWHPWLSGQRTNCFNPTWDTSAQTWGYRYYEDGQIVYYKGKVYQFDRGDNSLLYSSPGPDVDDTGVQYPDTTPGLWTELGTASWLPEGQSAFIAQAPSHPFGSANLQEWSAGNNPAVTYNLHNMHAVQSLDTAVGYLFDNGKCPSMIYATGTAKLSTNTFEPWIVLNGTRIGHDRVLDVTLTGPESGATFLLQPGEYEIVSGPPFRHSGSATITNVYNHSYQTGDNFKVIQRNDGTYEPLVDPSP